MAEAIGTLALKNGKEVGELVNQLVQKENHRAKELERRNNRGSAQVLAEGGATPR